MVTNSKNQITPGLHTIMSHIRQPQNERLKIAYSSFRIDLIGEHPLFGHYIIAEPGKFVADIHNTFTAVCSTDEPTFADVNCVDGALTNIRDNSNAGPILPTFDDRIVATDDVSRTDALMTDHLPISDDLSKLRAEEIWLENAIRERINVCSNFRKSSLVM